MLQPPGRHLRIRCQRSSSCPMTSTGPGITTTTTTRYSKSSLPSLQNDLHLAHQSMMHTRVLAQLKTANHCSRTCRCLFGLAATLELKHRTVLCSRPFHQEVSPSLEPAAMTIVRLLSPLIQTGHLSSVAGVLTAALCLMMQLSPATTTWMRQISPWKKHRVSRGFTSMTQDARSTRGWG